jgi:hypothetical protein
MLRLAWGLCYQSPRVAVADASTVGCYAIMTVLALSSSQLRERSVCVVGQPMSLFVAVLFAERRIAGR